MKSPRRADYAELGSLDLTTTIGEFERAGPLYAPVVDQLLRVKGDVLRLLHGNDDDQDSSHPDTTP